MIRFSERAAFSTLSTLANLKLDVWEMCFEFTIYYWRYLFLAREVTFQRFTNKCSDCQVTSSVQVTRQKSSHQVKLPQKQKYIQCVLLWCAMTTLKSSMYLTLQISLLDLSTAKWTQNISSNWSRLDIKDLFHNYEASIFFSICNYIWITNIINWWFM